MDLKEHPKHCWTLCEDYPEGRED